jgi:hypothetical protein
MGPKVGMGLTEERWSQQVLLSELWELPPAKQTASISELPNLQGVALWAFRAENMEYNRR